MCTAMPESAVPPAHHHHIFDNYEPWSGHVDAGWEVNFLGVRTKRMFVTDETPGEGGEVVASYPVVNEEYFEWIDLLESIEAATRTFGMIELGAGYGRWLANGGVAARARGLEDLHLVGVEAEPTHFRWMREHCDANNLEGAYVRLIQAAAAHDDGWVRFHVGDPVNWYGQAIDPNRPDFLPAGRVRDALAVWKRNRGKRLRSVERVRAVSLVTLLRDLDHVDLIDADIQGSEADVFEAAAETLTAKVARVHIGTHSRENEARLRGLFAGLGWECVNDFGSLSEADTEWGHVHFQDGVQSWVNRALSVPRSPTATSSQTNEVAQRS